MGWRRVLTGLALALAAGGADAALEVRFEGEDGRPLAGARIVVLGRAGTAVTDRDGRAVLDPAPIPPFELFVIRADGVALQPVRVERVPEDGRMTITVPSARAEQINVVGAAVGDLEAAPAGALTLLGRASLDERRPGTLTDAVGLVPGVSSSEPGLAGVPAVRGLAASRTLILLDDGRVSAERRAGPSASFLDPATVEEIEVVRGPGSVAYGSDAIGGVIRARTRIPDPGEPLSARLSVGAATGWGERSASATVNASVAGGGVVIGASHRRFGNYSTPDGTVPNSGGEFASFRLGWQRPVGPGSLRVLWRTDQGRDIGKPSADDATGPTSYPEDDSHRFTLAFEAPGRGPWSRISASTFWGESRVVTARRALDDSGGIVSIARADVLAHDYGLRFEAERGSAAGRVVVGIDLAGRFGLRATNAALTPLGDGTLHRDSLEVSIASARRDDLGAFVAADQTLGRVTVSGGLRADVVRAANRGGYFGDRRSSRSAVSGFAAATVPLSPALTGTVQVARGFRDALLSDRFYRGLTGRGTITGNPDLAPETSRQIDVAVRYRAGRVRAAAYGYLYRIARLIERSRVEGRDYVFRNRGEAEIRGFELEAGIDAGRGIDLGVGVQTLRGALRGDGAAIDSIPADGVFVTVADRSSRRGWWSIRLAAYARDRRPGPTEREIPGFATLEAAAGFPLSAELDIGVSARNVLDQSYFGSSDAAAVAAPGRAVLVTLGARL